MQHFGAAGTLDPDELSVAAKVLDRILAERGISRDSDDAEDMAFRVDQFAQMGLEADALYAAVTGQLEDAIGLLTSPLHFPYRAA